MLAGDQRKPVNGLVPAPYLSEHPKEQGEELLEITLTATIEIEQ